MRNFNEEDDYEVSDVEFRSNKQQKKRDRNLKKALKSRNIEDLLDMTDEDEYY